MKKKKLISSKTTCLVLFEIRINQVGAYSRGGLIREWGLNRSFTVCT